MAAVHCIRNALLDSSGMNKGNQPREPLTPPKSELLPFRPPSFLGLSGRTQKSVVGTGQSTAGRTVDTGRKVSQQPYKVGSLGESAGPSVTRNCRVVSHGMGRSELIDYLFYYPKFAFVMVGQIRYDQYDDSLFEALFEGALAGEIEFDQADLLQYDRAEFEHALAEPIATQVDSPAPYPKASKVPKPAPTAKPLITIPPSLDKIRASFFLGQETLTFSPEDHDMYWPFLNNIYTAARKEYAFKTVAIEQVSSGYQPAAVYNNMCGAGGYYKGIKYAVNKIGGAFFTRQDVINAGRVLQFFNQKSGSMPPEGWRYAALKAKRVINGEDSRGLLFALAV
ncbi:hypothetical protein B0T24DRAFT_593013 [Lasiosphaeria ovina]|uniref:Uncharacterized protein n=1 Tax=Lasiosphaeria ovina TaxID=92902 RepID=A0AAE0KJL3_9PEZI|nr:hypothetical protein B0T24DRAFT_593013 [Lasiosphaeria ovina]